MKNWANLPNIEKTLVKKEANLCGSGFAASPSPVESALQELVANFEIKVGFIKGGEGV